MIDTRQQILMSAGTFVLACILLGGTVTLLLLGRSVPEFLVGFDGVIVTATFANGGFFALARAVLPTHAALVTSLANYHELAISGTRTVSHIASGTIEHTGESEKQA